MRSPGTGTGRPPRGYVDTCLWDACHLLLPHRVRHWACPPVDTPECMRGQKLLHAAVQGFQDRKGTVAQLVETLTTLVELVHGHQRQELLAERDSQGRLALHTAASAKCLAAVRCLVDFWPLDKVAHLAECDAQGCTPLHYAALVQDEPTALFLLSSGADKHTPNHVGLAPSDFLGLRIPASLR